MSINVRYPLHDLIKHIVKESSSPTKGGAGFALRWDFRHRKGLVPGQ